MISISRDFLFAFLLTNFYNFYSVRRCSFLQEGYTINRNRGRNVFHLLYLGTPKSKMDAPCDKQTENGIGNDDNDESQLTEEEQKEREHFMRIINAFKYYKYVDCICISSIYFLQFLLRPGTQYLRD